MSLLQVLDHPFDCLTNKASIRPYLPFHLAGGLCPLCCSQMFIYAHVFGGRDGSACEYCPRMAFFVCGVSPLPFLFVLIVQLVSNKRTNRFLLIVSLPWSHCVAELLVCCDVCVVRSAGINILVFSCRVPVLFVLIGVFMFQSVCTCASLYFVTTTHLPAGPASEHALWTI